MIGLQVMISLSDISNIFAIPVCHCSGQFWHHRIHCVWSELYSVGMQVGAFSVLRRVILLLCDYEFDTNQCSACPVAFTELAVPISVYVIFPLRLIIILNYDLPVACSGESFNAFENNCTFDFTSSIKCT